MTASAPRIARDAFLAPNTLPRRRYEKSAFHIGGVIFIIRLTKKRFLASLDKDRPNFSKKGRKALLVFSFHIIITIIN